MNALFPVDPRRRYENAIVAWALVFYASYVAYVLGALPGWAFGALGVVAFVRYFNRSHEALHADQRGARWHLADDLLVLPSPIYIGRRELEELHRAHHSEHDGPGDPDLRMMDADPPRAALWCLLQPELYAWWQLRRRGIGRDLALRMAAHALAWAGLMWFGGWRGFVAYNIVVRLGNGLAWFVFAWVVHRPWLFGQIEPPDLPRPLRWLWIALLGRDNYLGVRFHLAHHKYPALPDRHLPAVARVLGAAAAASAPERA